MKNAVKFGSILIAFIILTASSFAATYTVTNATDIDDGGNCDANCSLREAINRANQTGAVDTIVFSALFNSPQTITLGSELQITGGLTITGPSGRLIISGNNAVRVFSVPNFGVTVSISNLTVSNGSAASGAGILNGGSLTLTGVTISGNSTTAGGFGGGIQNTRNLTVLNSTISGNSAANAGGINSTIGASLLVLNSTISGNTAGAQAGINNAGEDG